MSGAHHRRPSREAVQEAIELEAWRFGINPSAVCGATSRVAVSARRRAWKTILDETGCSMNGLAVVWGCERQAIRRGVMRTEGGRVAA